LYKGEVYYAVKDYGGAFESAQDVMMKKPYNKGERWKQSIKVNTIGIEKELADKAVSAILFPRLRSGHALLTFFLIAEKESKKVFPCFFLKKAGRELESK